MSNIRPYVIINGVDSRTITGLLITSLPPISKPAQRTLTETIDGRDGDSSIKLGYSAYDKSLGIALTFGYNVDDVISFFNSEGTIVFSNEPDKLYNFEIFEAIDFEKLIRFKTATVTIHTQPFKFSTTENPLEFTDKEFNVVNNGNTDSRPNLVITGEGLATMQINGKNALNIDFGDAGQTLLIDSEGMNAYHTNNIKSIEAEIVATGGNGTPDSPNPINGYTEANITRCGVNLLHVNSRVSQTTAQVIYTSDDNYIEMNGTKYGGTYADLSALTVTLPAGTYYLKAFEISGTATNAPSITAYNGSDLTSNILNNERTLTLSAPTTFRFRFALWTDNAVYTNYKIGIAISTASISEYSEYSGNTYTIAFGQTVYGGVLDVTSGKLKPCIEYSSYNGETLSGRWLSSEATYIEGTTPPTGSQVVSLDDYGTDIDLTPEQIEILLGINNFYADTGNVTVIFVNDGQDETQTGAIVSFDLDESDLIKGDLANRLVSGNYANIRLKTGSNAIKFIGSVSAVGLDKYSRWL